jgi:hypothetical protein
MSLNAYLGRRFAGLVLVAGILGAAYFVGPVDKFSALATTLGLMYGVYVGGQSYTDGKEK